MINPISPIPIILNFMLALGTTHWLARRFPVALPEGRVTAIDGLRGFLAFSVFVYHGGLWFFYLRTGQWRVDSDVYRHLGHAPVALFFMITGFLFFSKLLNAKRRPVDWSQFYVSRFFRLGPLYFVVMGALFLAVAALSQGQLRAPAGLLTLDAARWLAFTIPGAHDLNGVEHTWLIVAGVTWTLKYEWIFYLLLPLMAGLLACWPPAIFVLASALTMLALNWLALDYARMAAFVGGMAAAVLVRYEKVRVIACAKASTLLAAGCVAAVVLVFPTAYSPVPLLLLSLAFALVAGGNTLFGVLAHPTCRVLGEMAYSIYLLHGLVLFVAFRFSLGFTEAARLSAIEHWLVIALCTPVVIIMSFAAFHRIELPAMRMAPMAMHWIRTRRQAKHPSGCALPEQ